MKQDIELSPNITIPAGELEFLPIRAQGAGGQNVNKVSSAVHLRFDVLASSLPESCKQGLMALQDKRISKTGVIVIKSQQYRTQAANIREALARLVDMIDRASQKRIPRKPTRPSLGAKRKRMEAKTKRGQLKSMRAPVKW